MIEEIINKFTTTFYIQIWKNRLKVTCVKSGKIYDDMPLVVIDNKKITAIGKKASTYPNAINPFSHPRVIIDDYEIAEILLRYAFDIASERKLFFSPLGIIQVMEDMGTELTKLEKKALAEIAMNAGCRENIIYEGESLEIEKINFNELKKLT